jgi:uncharacterized protein YuzE
MENRKLKIKYDEENDILHVMVGNQTETMIVETEENFYMNISKETGEMIGYSISDYSENVHKNREWSDKLLTVPENIVNGSFSINKKAA